MSRDMSFEGNFQKSDEKWRGHIKSINLTMSELTTVLASLSSTASMMNQEDRTEFTTAIISICSQIGFSQDIIDQALSRIDKRN